MKISCFLTSFNRPMLLRRALASIAAQTHADYELFVLDESDTFDAPWVVGSFDFRCPKGRVKTLTWSRKPEERAAKNPMSWKLNEALQRATGDVVCFLADDDYYRPWWFDEISRYFMVNPTRNMGYGKLLHEKYGMIGPSNLVEDPLRVLDHNQVAHRRLDPPARWPEEMTKEIATAPDGYYFRAVRERFGGDPFWPIPCTAATKGHNPKSWLKSFGKEPIEGIRE